MKKHLNEVVDIDMELSKHGNKILIIAGVGAGKTTWVTKSLALKGSVLFVTSRRIKADADSHHTCFSNEINYLESINHTLITNAKLASEIKRLSEDPHKNVDDFMNLYDYIVIDEVHSIVTDSGFAEHCPTVLSYIEYAVEKQKNVIAMTGTPEPIIDYFKHDRWHIIDYSDICKYVHPEKLILTTRQSVSSIIARYWNDRKIIYFANRTDTIIDFCKHILENNDIAAQNIATIVAKSSEEDFYKKRQKEIPNCFNAISESSECVYESIISERLIPEPCKILFATSALREGIDIKNQGIVMICENHVLSNLIQYFGRARKRGCIVYVIEDAVDYPSAANPLLYKYAVTNETECANKFLMGLVENNERHGFIEYIEKSNPYIYYDVISKNFNIFALKYDEEQRIARNINWKKQILSYCQKWGINAFGDFCLKSTMLGAIERMAAKGFKDFSSDKRIIKNALKWAYGISQKQPQKINKEMMEHNSPFRIKNATENGSVNRNERYWMFIKAVK